MSYMLFIMIYFWSVTDVYRPQRKPETCLATIEAVYYFFKEYDQHILKRFENASTVPYLCKKIPPLILPCQISTQGKNCFKNRLANAAHKYHCSPPTPSPLPPIPDQQCCPCWKYLMSSFFQKECFEITDTSPEMVPEFNKHHCALSKETLLVVACECRRIYGSHLSFLKFLVLTSSSQKYVCICRLC